MKVFCASHKGEPASLVITELAPDQCYGSSLVLQRRFISHESQKPPNRILL